MVAERVPDVEETSRRPLSPGEAAKRLDEIWYKFEKSLRRPEDAGRRTTELKQLGDLLSPAAEKYLEEEVEVVREGRTVRQTRGLWIKGKATERAREDLREQRATVIAAKKKAEEASDSEKREIRRQKASQRRGTRPDLIH